MVWKGKSGDDFKKEYDSDRELQPLFDFAIELILYSDDPSKLPLTISCPGHPDSCMINLQNAHAVIFRIHGKINRIEFIHCQ